jgi:hypothetical protein
MQDVGHLSKLSFFAPQGGEEFGVERLLRIFSGSVFNPDS